MCSLHISTSHLRQTTLCFSYYQAKTGHWTFVKIPKDVEWCSKMWMRSFCHFLFLPGLPLLVWKSYFHNWSYLSSLRFTACTLHLHTSLKGQGQTLYNWSPYLISLLRQTEENHSDWRCWVLEVVETGGHSAQFYVLHMSLDSTQCGVLFQFMCVLVIFHHRQKIFRVTRICKFLGVGEFFEFLFL